MLHNIYGINDTVIGKVVFITSSRADHHKRVLQEAQNGLNVGEQLVILATFDDEDGILRPILPYEQCFTQTIGVHNGDSIQS